MSIECHQQNCLFGKHSEKLLSRLFHLVTSQTNEILSNIDVDDVKFVINYDFPSNVEDYIHRIGRTGRSNNKGTSYTFFTPSNSAKVDELINILNETNQVCRLNPQDLN